MIMYTQPTTGPKIPPIISHIYLAKPARRDPVPPLPTSGILAQLADLRRH
jgi:hypothetical protein